MLFTQSLVSSLHTVIQGVSITGQTGSKSALEKNAGVFLNPEQPLVQVSYFSCLVVNKLFCKTQLRAIVFFFRLAGSCDIGERHSQARGKSPVCPRETARSPAFVVIFSPRPSFLAKTQMDEKSNHIKVKSVILLLLLCLHPTPLPRKKSQTLWWCVICLSRPVRVDSAFVCYFVLSNNNFWRS